MFVPHKLFLTGLMCMGKTRSLPQSGVPKICFNQVGSRLTHKYHFSVENLPGKNTLAFNKNDKFRTKKFYNIGPSLIREEERMKL